MSQTPSPYASRFRPNQQEPSLLQQYQWHAEPAQGSKEAFYEAVSLTELEANRLELQLYALGVDSERGQPHPLDQTCSILVRGEKNIALLEADKLSKIKPKQASSPKTPLDHAQPRPHNDLQR